MTKKIKLTVQGEMKCLCQESTSTWTATWIFRGGSVAGAVFEKIQAKIQALGALTDRLLIKTCAIVGSIVCVFRDDGIYFFAGDSIGIEILSWLTTVWWYHYNLAGWVSFVGVCYLLLLSPIGIFWISKSRTSLSRGFGSKMRLPTLLVFSE